MLRIFLLLITLSTTFIIKAEEKRQEQEEPSPVNPFWDILYREGGWSLYCGLRFDNRGLTGDGKTLSIEHIYPVSRMLKSHDCNSRKQCYETGNKRFVQMESDLHNQYPVWLDLNNALYDSQYGEIEGEHWRYDSCDFERKQGVIEPRPLARGNIARAIFYMHSEYNLPVPQQTMLILKKWNREDPPSKQEKRRNDIIGRIQNRRNPYIDNPEMAESLIITQIE